MIRKTLVLGVACAAACAPSTPPTSNTEVVIASVDGGNAQAVFGDAGEPRAPASYTENASTLCARGDDEMARGDLDAATAIFQEVQKKYPYSKKAKDAELRLGDIASARGDWAGAARIYEKWLHDHRGITDEERDAVRAKLTEAQAHAGTK